MGTTLIEELEQATGDAENSARSYRLLGKTERDVVKAKLFEERAARLRARAERVRDMTARQPHGAEGDYVDGWNDCLKRITGPSQTPQRRPSRRSHDDLRRR